MYKKFKAVIHLADLIQHNSQLANPLNQIARAMKEISGKRNKTEADHAKLAELEFRGSLYLNAQGEVVLPGRLLEAGIHAGAKKHKQGPSALAAVFVDNDPVIEYDGGPLSVDELLESDAHRLVVPVKVGQARVMRTRPIFHNVRAEVALSLDTEICDPDALRLWLESMLNRVGIGDWRPRHGRGELVSFKAVKAPVEVAA